MNSIEGAAQSAVTVQQIKQKLQSGEYLRRSVAEKIAETFLQNV